MTDSLTLRINRAAESLLDNETLTADLDDAIAQSLIDWGLACSQSIATATRGLDDQAAETYISPKLRAVRLLMRQVNQWVARSGEMDEQTSAASLRELIELAASIYPDYQQPDNESQQAFLREPFPIEPSGWIVKLRKLIE